MIKKTWFYVVPTFAVACGSSNSDPERRDIALVHENSVVPTLFFSDGAGNTVSDSTPDDTVVYRALPGQPDIVQLTDTDGEPLTWGNTRKARGEMRMHCADDGTEIQVDAQALRPNGVYTGWLAFFDEPGFAAAGPDALLAISPVGPADGSESVFVASDNGSGKLESLVPAARATVPFLRDVEIPACLLDTFEVHVVLAYHPDGKTCGDNPCEAEKFVEQLAWIVNEGKAAP